MTTESTILTVGLVRDRQESFPRVESLGAHIRRTLSTSAGRGQAFGLRMDSEVDTSAD